MSRRWIVMLVLLLVASAPVEGAPPMDARIEVPSVVLIRPGSPRRTRRFPRAAAQLDLHGDPQKRSRPCLCQFGVGLPTDVPGYRIGQLLSPGNYGHHSYGKPSPGEHDGQVYTCAAGFVDSTHVRAGIDWTANLVVMLDRVTATGGVLRYGPDGGGVRLVVHRSPTPLGREDLLRLAQRLAYERLTWHEIMSWYYHAPVRTFGEQQSTFSPEDASSNFLGTVIARRAIEIVEETDMPFEDAVDVAFADRMVALGVVRTADETRQGFAQVDRHQNGPVTGAEWFDSGVVFWDQRYLFKRNIHALTTVFPWRVPAGAEIGCDGAIAPFIGRVPRTTVLGVPLTDLYEWHFTPERKYFRVSSGPNTTEPNDPRFKHTPLPIDVTNRDLPAVLKTLEAEMRAELGEQFDDPDAPYEPQPEAVGGR